MPPKRSIAKIMHRAAELRQTTGSAEIKLWAHLRTLREAGFHFRRQHAIGPYITDFCTPRERLIIEVDGSHHLDQEEYDNNGTLFLRSKGYRLLRFWNSDVLSKLDSVMGVILLELNRAKE